MLKSKSFIIELKSESKALFELLHLREKLSVGQNFGGAKESEHGVDKHGLGLLHLVQDFVAASVQGHRVEVRKVAQAFERFVAERLARFGALQHGRVLWSDQDDLERNIYDQSSLMHFDPF